MTLPLPPHAPLLAGVIDRADGVMRYAGAQPRAPLVDLVEVRVDLFDPPVAISPACAAACARLEADGVPVLVTIRLAAEGGRWTAPDAERLPLLRQALEVASIVDVEASSPLAAEVAALAHARGATVIASYHDFARTPSIDELVRIADSCRAAGGDVAKIATTVAADADRDALYALLARRPERTCAIAMGAGAEALRIELPARGSLLAYGYLDRPTAPGQLSAATMDERLRAACPTYRKGP
jgi:3-dehydroquinate dehydratase-1